MRKWTNPLIILDIGECQCSGGISNGGLRTWTGEPKSVNWTQRNNYATFFFSLVLTLLSVVSIVSVSTLCCCTSKNLTIPALLFPKSPVCQFLFGREHLEKYSKDMSQSDVVSNRGRRNCVQALASASDCKLCHMQMAVSGAIHPQLLSGGGSGAYYSSDCSSELMSSCGWLDVWSLQKLPPSELARSRESLSGEVVLTWGVQGCWHPYTHPIVFFIFHHYSTRSPSSVTSVFFCVQVVHREDREEAVRESEEN